MLKSSHLYQDPVTTLLALYYVKLFVLLFAVSPSNRIDRCGVLKRGILMTHLRAIKHPRGILMVDVEVP